MSSLNSRERMLRAASRQPVDRPPLWVMRQAGRYLPEYRALKQKYTFVQLVQNPELAAQVTLQPLKRFDLDAAILFSDILVIPEAMGMPYAFRDGGGISMDWSFQSESDLDRLSTAKVEEALDYVFKTLSLLRSELQGNKALIGFSGSPWTLATYMVEGASSKNFTRIKTLLYTRPELLHRLLEKISEAVLSYLRLQIEAGADLIQIFDSWGGILAADQFEIFSARYMRKIVAELNHQVPVIVFSKGSQHSLAALQQTQADILGFDWTADLPQMHSALYPKQGVQGNLDPALLSTNPQTVRRETGRLLQSMDGRQGFIFNLGHGILPDAGIDCMEALLQSVTEFRYSR